jgi:diguanylate cyclase (GGDEF)-like protein
MVEGSRWLFTVLCLVSVLIAVPVTSSGPSGVARALAAVAAAGLALSVVAGYRRRRASLVGDAFDVVALFTLAVASPAPGTVLGILFAALWFRSLYGTTARAVLRSTGYAVAVVAALSLWSHVPGHPGSAEIGPVLGAVPTMFLTVVVSRHLAGLLQARQQAARRDAIHAALGPRLLAVQGAGQIRDIAWEAITGICDVTPGLRVLKVVPDGDVWQIRRASHDLPSPAPVLVRDALPDLGERGAPVTAFTSTQLDRAVDAHCTWVSIPQPDVPDERARAWFLLGFTGAVLAEVVTSLTSLSDQVTLALRNSEVHRELTQLATLDNLTGLANRASFNAALLSALNDPRHRAQHTTVLFVDLDDFKDVNDNLGHNAGDELLREVAARLTHATRPGDLCARLGGDEFAVLLRATPASLGAEIAERVVDGVGAPVALREGDAQVGASIGVATAVGPTSKRDLVHCADVAMYAAKAKGKGRVQVFEPGLLEREPSTQSYEDELALAADGDELVVHYQPVLSLDDGRCTAVEALVRWQHPTMGLVPPDEFIATAERTGAIIAIGRFVLRRACLDLAAWDQSRPGLGLVLHVNVSALQLDDHHFVSDVIESLEDAGLAPDRLVLEITETSLVTSPAAVANLEQLAVAGTTLAMDDFGVGYSSLKRLRTLPIQILKIDRSFVAGSTLNPDDRAVIEAIVSMATRMGLRTIAEGVESLAEQTFLTEVGAGEAQGYLFQRPCSADQLDTWLDAQSTVVVEPARLGTVTALVARADTAR